RPVGDCVAAVFHGLGFAIGRSHRAAIQVVAADHDGRLNLAFFHQIVHGQAELGTFAISKPADPCWQSLELDAFPRQVDPAIQDAVLREELQHQVVSNGDIGRVAGESQPAEGPAAFAKQWTDISGYEAGKVVGIFHATLEGEGADVVAVVEGNAAHLLQTQH